MGNRFALVLGDKILALGKDRRMVEAYRDYKQEISESSKIVLLDKKSYNMLARDMEGYVLEETDYGVPLTHNEVMYVDSQLDDMTSVVDNAVNAIKRVINYIDDEHDADTLVRAVKALNDYSSERKAFRNSGLGDSMRELFASDIPDKNPMLKLVEDRNIKF